MIDLLITKVIEQLQLVILAISFSILLGVPLGIIIYSKNTIKKLVLSTISLMWTIPSLALLALFIPFLGIGTQPALVVLTIYALLPIVRNTIVGLESIDPALLEAAEGLGFTHHQCMFKVMLPLAMPIIISGVRTALSITVGVATLAAFVGAGGLGDFINQGLAMNDATLLFMGALPAALMALWLDISVGFFEKDIQKNLIRTPIHRCKQVIIYGVFFSMIGLLSAQWFTLLSDGSTHAISTKPRTSIVIATKNFTEQFILGELVAQMLEQHTSLQVIRKFNLGSSAIVHEAMVQGAVDMYPEYTGTAYMITLGQKKILSAQATFSFVQQAFQQQFQQQWLPPFGFNNTQAIMVRQTFAEQHQLHTITDLQPLAPQLSIAAPAEFLKRADAFIGLKRIYQLQFKTIRQMDPGLMYSAIKTKQVDVVAGFATDGRVKAYGLKILADNKHFYPPYYAAMVVRQRVLKQFPEIETALKPLWGLISTEDMQRLNYLADVQHQSPKTIAHEFLQSHQLLTTKAR